MLQLRLEDNRRLTGPNLFSSVPGAVIDVEQAGKADPAALQIVADVWLRHAQVLLKRLEWSKQETFSRLYKNGISLGITAPIDALYSATELCEAAWQSAQAELASEPSPDFENILRKLSEGVESEMNPALVRIENAARAHGVPFLYDDDVVSIGYGEGCQQWPVERIPEDIDYQACSAVPLVLITGTNGKSTSVRLTASVLDAARLCTGVTSTDYIRVGEEIIDRGDYSGPGGARTLLRDSRTEVAVLEVARGGMLRRGLGVFDADAALITNVAADHLGDYGINSVPELIEAKFIVTSALSEGAPLVLNADDAGIVNHAKQLSQAIIWFSERTDNPILQAHIAKEGRAVTLVDHTITRIETINQKLIETKVVEINQIPITIAGAARHNVQNALGVTGLCWAIGVSDQAIESGLSRFRGTSKDNPGRGNYFEAHGVKILIDYAHNEHGMNAITTLIRNIPAKRRLIMMGQAGDRSNELIGDLVQSAMKADPEEVVVYEVPGYERGRPTGETPRVITQAFVHNGFEKTSIQLCGSPLEGIANALKWAKSGDLLLLIVLTSRDESLQLIEEFVSSPRQTSAKN